MLDYLTACLMYYIALLSITIDSTQSNFLVSMHMQLVCFLIHAHNAEFSRINFVFNNEQINGHTITTVSTVARKEFVFSV